MATKKKDVNKRKLPEATRKDLAKYLTQYKAYSSVENTLQEDPHDYSALEALKSLTGITTLAREPVAVLRQRANNGKTTARSDLTNLVSQGDNLDVIVRDAVYHAKDVDADANKQVAYVINLMASVPYPKDKATGSGLEKPFQDYRALQEAVAKNDVATIAKVLIKDSPKQKGLLENIAATNAEAIVGEGYKRLAAKQEEITRLIATQDKDGKITGINRDVVREYLLKGLEATDPKEKEGVYSRFMSAANPALEKAGYKL